MVQPYHIPPPTFQISDTDNQKTQVYWAQQINKNWKKPKIDDKIIILQMGGGSLRTVGL